MIERDEAQADLSTALDKHYWTSLVDWTHLEWEQGKLAIWKSTGSGMTQLGITDPQKRTYLTIREDALIADKAYQDESDEEEDPTLPLQN
ncbi:unnamed protein product [Sympodiomycopsis kandeliae]